eukprot:50388-Chlamydomonas_euryale.AAC.1
MSYGMLVCVRQAPSDAVMRWRLALKPAWLAVRRVCRRRETLIPCPWRASVISGPFRARAGMADEHGLFRWITAEGECGLSVAMCAARSPR